MYPVYKCVPVLLGLVLALPASARVLKTGDLLLEEKAPPADSDELQKPQFIGPPVNTTLTPKEEREALAILSKNLPQLLANGQFTETQLHTVLALLASPAPNVRRQATAFFQQNRPALIKGGLVNPQLVDGLSRDVYNSEHDLMMFLGLMHAFLPHSLDTQYFNSEYTYVLIEGLNSKNRQVAQLSADLIKQHAQALTDKLLWAPAHTKKFFLLARDLPPDNFQYYLDVLRRNFRLWAERGFMTKEDITSLRQITDRAPGGAQQSFLNLLASQESVAPLQKLGMFDRTYAESLMEDIRGTDNSRKQQALEMYANFLAPLAQNEALTQTDFNTMWDYLIDNIESFDDPFALILRSSGKWLSKSHVSQLLDGFADKSRTAQKKILTFVQDNHATLAKRGWITTGQLAEITALQAKDSRKTQISKLTLAENHSSQTGRIDSTQELDQFLANFRIKDPDVFARTLQIFDDNLVSWTNRQLFDKDRLADFVGDLNSGERKTAKLIGVIDRHFATLFRHLDADILDTISSFTDSALPEVSDAARLFFENHALELSKARLLTREVKKLLKEAKIGSIREPERRIGR